MQKKREQRIERMQRVMREYHTALVALNMLGELLAQNPSALNTRRLSPNDFKNLRRNLETTFLVRLFAEFESGLRDLWSGLGRSTVPKMLGLLASLAAVRAVPATAVRHVHDVRLFRNALVHEEAEHAPPVTLSEATRRLQYFFSRMPADW